MVDNNFFYKLTDDYYLPEGTRILTILHAIHMDPKHHADPTSFNPDRFLSENTADKHPFSYVPFSAGSRNCIGKHFNLLISKSRYLDFVYFYVDCYLLAFQFNRPPKKQGTL